MSERIRAIRGAITVPVDTAEEVTSATRLVLEDMIARNALSPDDMVSLALYDEAVCTVIENVVTTWRTGAAVVAPVAARAALVKHW